MRAHQERGASGKRECWGSSRGQITINKGLKVEAEESGHPCLRKRRSFLCGDHMHQAVCLQIPSVTFMKIEWGDEAKKGGPVYSHLIATVWVRHVEGYEGRNVANEGHLVMLNSRCVSWWLMSVSKKSSVTIFMLTLLIPLPRLLLSVDDFSNQRSSSASALDSGGTHAKKVKDDRKSPCHKYTAGWSGILPAENGDQRV